MSNVAVWIVSASVSVLVVLAVGVAFALNSTKVVVPAGATYWFNADEVAVMENACLHERLALPKRSRVTWKSGQGSAVRGAPGAVVVTEVHVTFDGEEAILEIEYIEAEVGRWYARRKDGE